MTKIKVLSLQQPFAFLLCTPGAKCFETRPYRTHYRGTVYIHASKEFYFSDLDIVRENKHFKKFIKDPSDGTLITSAIIGKVDIVDCVPTASLLKISDQERAFGDYTPGRYVWMCKNPVLFKKPLLNVRGMLGIWDYEIPEETILHFEDHGQDFLQWHLNKQGLVVDCQPFQASVWNGSLVYNHDSLKPGDRLMFMKDGQTFNLKYPVEKIEVKEVELA